MSALTDRLDDVIARRHESLPEVEAILKGWEAARDSAQSVSQRVREAAQIEPLDEDVLAAFALLEAGQIEMREQAIAQRASVVRERFSRETINVGVSGVARVGKSTLLQSVTGLGDEQIPTAAGDPVTAVRSQIFNSADRNEAIVSFYTWAGFIDEILRPLHDSLSIAAIPNSPDDWRAITYPRDIENDETAVLRANLRRCTDMQSALESFRALFGQPPRSVPLQDLRKYVAYPELGADVRDRPYVAVASAIVNCSFPSLESAKLGLIDLPGLGEISPRAESRHVDSLTNEVDTVLVVKRPDSNQTSYWSKPDANAFKLIQEARGSVSRISDFCGVVMNVGGPGVTDVLETTLAKNIKEIGPSVKAYRADCADPASVQRDLLQPLLEHLAKRLPVMDAEVLGELRSESADQARALLGAADSLAKALSTRVMTGNAQQELTIRTIDARRALAGALESYELELDDQIAKTEATSYIEGVKACYDAAIQWVDEDAYSDEDITRIRLDMVLEKGSGGVTAAELNRIRIEVSERFAGIESHFAGEVQEAARRVRDILADQLGGLVPTTDDPIADLRSLAELVESADPPSPNMADALREFANTTFSYRTHLYPDVRDVIKALLAYQSIDPNTGEETVNIGPYELTETGARALVKELKSRGRQVAFRSRQVLLDRASTGARLVHAVTEHLTDRLLRHQDSQFEFQWVTQTYREPIWPGVFEKLFATRAVSGYLRSDVAELRTTLNELARSPQ